MLTKGLAFWNSCHKNWFLTTEFLPPLFPSDDPILRLGLDSAARGSENDVTAGVVVDENYEELYSKLIASTARSAALANRLAEIHR